MRDSWAALGMPARAFWDLRKEVSGISCYVAGLPRFPRIFARDSLKTALLLDSPKLLRSTLDLAARHLGQR